VAANVILALGQLCVAGGEDVEPYTDRLMAIIIPILEDPSVIAKRDAALKTLGFLCSSTGYVIKPLLDYPQLFDLLGKLLKGTEHNTTLKQEVMRLLGILGALDPYRRQVM
jgi:FKBP12-rapamycin complex-associated protein